MKYFPILLILLALVATFLSFEQPGSGWGAGAIAGAGLAGIWLGITKYRTGQWFSDSAAGH